MTKIETILANFSKHNDLLRKLGYKDIKDYICPICLKHFSMKDTEKLSLEDAPPKALGGKKIAVTCKACNNTCGHEIDNHLTNAIDVTDANTFTPGSNSRVIVKNKMDDILLNGRKIVWKDGSAEIEISGKSNDSRNLQERLPQEKIYVNVTNILRPDRFKAKVSLLKTAYMILFSKFGYTFLLDENYNVIREQILNPDKPVLPEIMVGPPPIQREGIYTFQYEGMKGFFIIFSCKYQTEKTHKFLVMIPAPIISYEKFYEDRVKLAGHRIKTPPIIDDYLFNIDSIKKIYDWCYTV